ncbi:MAG: glutamate ABC transporter substrate-binding protein [Cellulomonadaceae bacterium]|jgi:glutamate transport system substrate-binding protein|nr:glutamate ABC transporter substrate-binding protein [Cellulomonadaceae bacterium]
MIRDEARRQVLRGRVTGTVAAWLVLALGLTLGLSGCSQDAVLAPTDDASQIRIGIKFDQPGLGYMQDGSPTGFDVDVAAYIAWKLGFSPYVIEWVETVSPEREAFLTEGKVDFIVASYTINDERREQVDFAGPYFVAGQDLLVRAEDASIAGPADLVGKKVCSAEGSSSIYRLRDMLGDTAEIVGRERLSECVSMLAMNEVDAVSSDDLILAGYAAQDEWFGKVRVVGEHFSTEELGIGLPPGSPAICEQINEALRLMVEDGSWEKFIVRHTAGTGFDPLSTGNPPKPVACQR